MSTITLNLTVEDVNGILATLGELPSKSNAWPLMKKIEEQATNQPKEEKTDGSES